MGSTTDTPLLLQGISGPINLEDTLAHFLGKLNTHTPYGPAILLLAMCPRDTLHVVSGDGTRRFTAVLFVRTKRGTTHKNDEYMVVGSNGGTLCSSENE